MQEAEEKGVAEQAVEAAKGALVEIMRQTIPASPRSAEYSSPQSVPLRRRMNNELNFPPNFEGLGLGCIDADFIK